MDETARLRAVIDQEATKLEIEASYWLPGLRDNLRNPYARQMHSAFKASAARLRAALDPPPAPDALLDHIRREADRDTDFSPI